MGFKDMVAADNLAVFLDVETFGEIYRIEGREIPIVLDTDELKERAGRTGSGGGRECHPFYALTSDLPPRRAPGESLNVNGRECIVDDWKEDMGMATVVLRENIVA